MAMLNNQMVSSYFCSCTFFKTIIVDNIWMNANLYHWQVGATTIGKLELLTSILFHVWLRVCYPKNIRSFLAPLFVKGRRLSQFQVGS